jgi:hypothetical protein
MFHLKTLTFEDGRSLEIHSDDDAESPREWDNNGIMLCWSRRHSLGDKHDYQTPQDFQEWKKEQGDNIIACLPLYLYDHSGITMSTGPFTCPWDSGQVGWIIATRESLASGGHNVDELDVAKVEEWLRGEVETYDQHIRGDRWGFIVRKPHIDCDCPNCDGEGEEEDSCWGFYGDDPAENGMLDHLDDEMRDAIRAGKFTEKAVA